MSVTIALAGNPNSGKTTIFNNITGSRQHVGNYAGVTVERREGYRRYQGQDMLLVDLPGTYSLTAHSLDELVARNVIIDEKPDVIVNILDASNLERNLYLAVQLLELERPMVLVLNMTDVAQRMGLEINENTLCAKLGIPVVRTIGARNHGAEDLLATVQQVTSRETQAGFFLDYGAEIETAIDETAQALVAATRTKYPTRWLALRLLENDSEAKKAVQALPGGASVLATLAEIQSRLTAALGESLDIVIAERRYAYVSSLYEAIAVHSDEPRRSMSDTIDTVLTNRILGLPLFFAIMWLLFNVVFTVGAYPQDWLERGVAWAGETIAAYLPEGELKSLVVDGIIGGVGSVIVFLPNILLLFLGITILEDTGYMARAAFVMDRVMRAVGLHGKSFIPLLLGFGCSVPAIMGTRTLENPRDRLVTILVTPLMSCSARLPVYTVLIGAFFTEELAGTVLFSVYFIGIALAILMAMLFRKGLFPRSSEPFVMEMPPYHFPAWRSILTQMGERSALYIKKAGTLILAASILVWFMTNYPNDVRYSKDYEQEKQQITETFDEQVSQHILAALMIDTIADSPQLTAAIAQLAATQSSANEDEKTGSLAAVAADLPGVYQYALQYVQLAGQRDEGVSLLEKEQAGEKLAQSYAGQIGKMIEPAIQPLGFDWKVGVGLVTAVAAKEVLVSTLGTIYSVSASEGEAAALQDALAADTALSPLAAYSLMLFTLIYSPCLAALAVIRRETNSWKWMAFSFVYSTALAWVVSLGVYQIGTKLGL